MIGFSILEYIRILISRAYKRLFTSLLELCDMRNWRIFIPIAFVLIVIVTGLRGTTKMVVRMAGSTAFLPFAERLSEVYMEKHHDVVIEVQGGGSATGIMAALQGIVDVGMVDLLILPKVTNSLGHVTVARDGIAIVVNPDNDVSGVTSEQLGDIFSGKIQNWQELGGTPGPIRVVSREDGSGTRTSFDALVLKGRKLTSEALFQDSNGTIREAVERDPQAIGYISIGFLVPQIKSLTIDGVEASNTNVVSGTYRFARPVYLLTQPHPTVQSKAFVDYILSTEGQQIIAKDGLIPVHL